MLHADVPQQYVVHVVAALDARSRWYAERLELARGEDDEVYAELANSLQVETSYGSVKLGAFDTESTLEIAHKNPEAACLKLGGKPTCGNGVPSR